MNQQTPNQGDILQLLKKIADSTATDEEKAIVLKKLNASMKEFGYLVNDLRRAIKDGDSD